MKFVNIRNPGGKNQSLFSVYSPVLISSSQGLLFPVVPIWKHRVIPYIRDTPAKRGRTPRVIATVFGTTCVRQQELLRYLRTGFAAQGMRPHSNHISRALGAHLDHPEPRHPHGEARGLSLWTVIVL